MKRNQGLLMACVLGLGLSAESVAGVIDVDGKLNDWGLSTQWTPGNNDNGIGTYSYNTLTIHYSVEDYTGGYNLNGQVDPGYGGQAYDAEALYVTWDAENLYIALVTGHNPETPNNPSKNTYSTGDFALAFWDGTSTLTYSYGIETKGDFGYKGGIYKVSKWSESSLWGKPHITSISAGNKVNEASLAISTSPLTNIGSNDTDKHWIYELSAPLSAFGDIAGKKLSVYWTMNCANDMIEADPEFPTRVDEPPVWALLGLTLPVAFWRRRRSAKR